MDIKLDQHKVTFRNSFTKTTIQFLFSFHNQQSLLIVSYLSVKGEFSETTITISRKYY